MHKLNTAVERFCAKHPKFGISNLMRYIVFGTIIVYVLYLATQGSALYYLSFHPALFLRGQLWRIVSFLFVPNTFGPLWLIVSLYFYYFIGNALEQQWGKGKFTIFYLSGAILTIIAALAAYFITGTSYGVAGTYYINMSLFFAFASLYPNHQVLLFFVLPVRMKWLAWADVVMFAIAIVMGIIDGSLIAVLLPLVAIGNYLLYFGSDLWELLMTRVQVLQNRRQRRPPKLHQAARKTSEQQGYLHKCTVCGRTDSEYRDLEFRYCSKCSGYSCYCIDHINSHIHH